MQSITGNAQKWPSDNYSLSAAYPSGGLVFVLCWPVPSLPPKLPLSSFWATLRLPLLGPKVPQSSTFISRAVSSTKLSQALASLLPLAGPLNMVYGTTGPHLLLFFYGNGVHQTWFPWCSSWLPAHLLTQMKNKIGSHKVCRICSVPTLLVLKEKSP